MQRPRSASFCLVGAAVYMTWTARFLMVVRG
jgi:hypothetical protein